MFNFIWNELMWCKISLIYNIILSMFGINWWCLEFFGYILGFDWFVLILVGIVYIFLFYVVM